MPRRDDIHKILLIGSGPIVIGQAAEFDYSGTQACRVLGEEGYEVVLVNSNPATIMTDPEVAATTYIEPLLRDPVAQVIERERPDAMLPTLGGQTALNLAKTLKEDGTLDHYGVELIGADYEAIDRAEDRERFRETMRRAGLRVPRSAIAHSIEDARDAVPEIGLPFIVRPAFTLGGTGGGVVRSEAELGAVVGPSGARTIDRDEAARWETDYGAAELTHVNLYDRTVEGLRLLDVPGATVQYHPEAGPGPNDALHLFDRFVGDIVGEKARVGPLSSHINRPDSGAPPGGRV